MPITHVFVSPVADAGDPNEVGPNEWNDSHTLPTPAEIGASPTGHVHTHAAATGQTADDHHNQSHAHNGADSSGTVAHSATTGQGVNDHHTESHQARHNSGGADAVKLDDLATPDDNTDLNASATRHGLLAKLSNIATEFLNGQGAFSTPGSGAPIDYPYLGFGANSNLSAEVDVETMILQNEIKGFPSLAGIDIDLATNAQWWDYIGTPTNLIQTDVAGEAGITETFEYALECTTDAADEGFQQTYTFVDEPRLKSGRTVSLICKIWCVGGLGVTVKLVNSDASETAAAEVTAAAWTTVRVNAHALAGTTCDLRFIADGAGTFYVAELTLMIGNRAISLKARGLLYRHMDSRIELVNLDAAADPNTWTDIDCTSVSSSLTAIAQVHALLQENTSSYVLDVRRNGGSEALDVNRRMVAVDAGTPFADSTRNIILDDAQIFEYILDRFSGTNALNQGRIYLEGFLEWE